MTSPRRNKSPIHLESLVSSLFPFTALTHKQVAMGIVGAGNHDYDADYVFATRDTLWREEHLHHYKPTDFDCIILDEYEIIGLSQEAA